MTLEVTSNGSDFDYVFTFVPDPGGFNTPQYQPGTISGLDTGLLWGGLGANDSLVPASVDNQLLDASSAAVPISSVNTIFFNDSGPVFSMGFGNGLGDTGFTIASGSITYTIPGASAVFLDSGVYNLTAGAYKNAFARNGSLDATSVPEPSAYGLALALVAAVLVVGRRQWRGR